MTGLRSTFLSLPVVAVVVGGLTLALVLLDRYAGLGPWGFALLAIPIALAAGYLAWYRTLPYEPARPGPSEAPAVPTDEPFEDPVEEADELERASAAEPPGESPGVAEDEPDAPPGAA